MSGGFATVPILRCPAVARERWKSIGYRYGPMRALDGAGNAEAEWLSTTWFARLSVTARCPFLVALVGMHGEQVARGREPHLIAGPRVRAPSRPDPHRGRPVTSRCQMLVSSLGGAARIRLGGAPAPPPRRARGLPNHQAGVVPCASRGRRERRGPSPSPEHRPPGLRSILDSVRVRSPSGLLTLWAKKNIFLAGSMWGEAPELLQSVQGQ